MTVSKSIWFKPYTLAQVNQHIPGNAAGHMGIIVTEIGDDYLIGTMPVTEKTVQTMGIVHGGANVLLAETLGSIGANLLVDPEKQYCVGQEVNANHVRSAAKGHVTAKAQVLHAGSRSQVWEIKIYNDDGKLTCISRLTMAVVDGQALQF